MDVSIVIRTKNEGEFIDETLKRVEKQQFNGSYEIIVVDSGSTDFTLSIIKEYNVRLLEIPQQEFSYGRSLNVGAMNSEGAFIVNLSAHALPSNERWLTSLMAGFESRDVAGVYGRQLALGQLNPFEALQNELFFGEKKIVFNTKNRNMLKGLHFSNSNSAVRKDVWQRFKFNEQVPYAEDVLWQAEVVDAGFSIVYVPDAKVYHTHRLSLYNTYKSSRDCAHALALMKRKRQSFPLVMYDLGILLALMPKALFRNIWYMWRHKYLEYLMTAPLYVLSGWLGWLAGRIRYRFDK